MRLLRPITFAQVPYAAATPLTHTQGAPVTRSRALAGPSPAPAFGIHLLLLRGDRAALATFRRRGTLPRSPIPSERRVRCEKNAPVTIRQATRRGATRAHSRRAGPDQGRRARNQLPTPMRELPESRGRRSKPGLTPRPNWALPLAAATVEATRIAARRR